MRVFSFIVLLFVTSNCVFGQLVEVGGFKGYKIHEAQALGEKLLIPGSDGKRYITTDFTDLAEIEQPFVDSYMFDFITNEELYFFVREPYVSNPKHLLKLNQQNGLDTVATINVSGTWQPRFIYASNTHAYFKINTKTFVIRLVDGLVKELAIDLTAYNDYHLTDTGVYLFADHLLWLHTDSTNAVQGEINFSQTFGYYTFLPHFNRSKGFFFLYQDSSQAPYNLKGAFTNGDLIVQSYVLPRWTGDSTFKARIMSELYEANQLSGWGGRAKDYTNDFEFSALHSKSWRYDGPFASDYESYYSWLLYDEANDIFKISTDTTYFSCFQNPTEVINLQGGQVAFTFYEKAGYELVGLSADSAYLLKDIFPGMSSFLQSSQYFQEPQYIVREGVLYFEAVNAHLGKCIYRSDGTKTGTGLIVDLPFDLPYGGYPIHVYDNSFYFINGSKVFKINKNTPFLPDKPALYEEHNAWNQRIVREMATYCERYSGGGGALRPMHLQKKGDNVLVHTNDMRSKRYFLPDQGIVGKESSYYYNNAFAIFDTSGKTTFHSYIGSNSFPSKMALCPNNNLTLAINHVDSTFNGFEKYYSPVRKMMVFNYNLSGTKNWQLELPKNISLINLESDELGNTYLFAYYTSGSLYINANVSLNSPYSHQYFMLKIDVLGNVKWANNVSMEGFRYYSSFGNLQIDHANETIYQLISEGSVNVASSCKFNSWYSKVVALNANTGLEKWTVGLSTNDLALYTGLTVSDVGDVWVSGGFRGKLSLDNGITKMATGEANCPMAGVLIKIDAQSGFVKNAFVRPNGRYNSISAGKGELLTAFISATNQYHADSTYAKVLSIERLDNSGTLRADYKSPVYYGRYLYQSQMQLLAGINESNDWLMLSYSMDEDMFTDTTFISDQNVESYYGNALLMRRPGNIFKSIEADNPVTWGSETYVVYPNPSRHKEVFINAQAGAEPFTAYQLVALDGRIVASGEISGQEWPLYLNFETSVKSGLYILRLTGRNHSKSFKLVFE